MDNIAIFGGTFDPVHLGHLNLARTAVDELDLTKLYFMPNSISPFKQDEKISSSQDRCNMINLSIDKDSKLELLEYEIEKKGISYTFNTLSELSKKFDSELYFVLGYDSLIYIDTWYMGKEILKNFPLISGVRPGIDEKLGNAKINEYNQKYNARINILHLHPFDCSSSKIRELASQGKSLNGLIEKNVEIYIKENGLYKY